MAAVAALAVAAPASEAIAQAVASPMPEARRAERKIGGKAAKRGRGSRT